MQVVLPLLQNEVVATGWMSLEDYLTGFALVQAMPGPLFNIAAYLGECSLLGSLADVFSAELDAKF
jgi:chromate transport protein ChrA